MDSYGKNEIFSVTKPAKNSLNGEIHGLTDVFNKELHKILPLYVPVTLLLCTPSDGPQHDQKLTLSGYHLDVSSVGIYMQHRGS